MKADLKQLPELLRQADEAKAAARTAIDAKDYGDAAEALRRLEEIAVFARFVVLAAR